MVDHHISMILTLVVPSPHIVLHRSRRSPSSNTRTPSDPLFIMVILSSAVAVVLFTGHAFAAPTIVARNDSSADAKSVLNLMGGAIDTYLASQNIKVNSFFALEGWQTVDFAGANAAVDNDTANNIVYLKSDVLQNNNGSKEQGGTTFFSTMFVNFIQEVNKALALNGTADSKDLDTAQDAQGTACFEDLPKAANKAVELYSNIKGQTIHNISDPGFLSWASTGYAPFQSANAKCQEATNAYNAEFDKVHGDNFGIFSGAANNIVALTTGTSTVHPGITMSIDSTRGQDLTTPFGGNVVPQYSIPVLAGTVASWQSNSGGNTAFAFDSSKQTGNDQESSSSNGAHAGIQWGRVDLSASASHSESESNNTVTAQTFQLSFGGIALMDIERGIWFDGWRSANALSTASDDKTKEALPAFKQFFGDKEKPGPAALYNDKALVVYQPTITIEFSSRNDYSKFQQNQEEASGCFLIFCGGQQHSDQKNTTTFDEQKSSVTFKDDSSNAYIIGFLQKSFWLTD